MYEKRPSTKRTEIDYCKKLFCRKYSVAEISRQTGVPIRTINKWMLRFGWKKLLHEEGPLIAASKRLETVFEIEDKTDRHFREIDQLIASIDKLNKIYEKYVRTIQQKNTGDNSNTDNNNSDNSNTDNNNSDNNNTDNSNSDNNSIQTDTETPTDRKKRRRSITAAGKRKNNDLSGISARTVTAKFYAGLFEYQKQAWQERNNRIRNYLKSRQIGMTWYFAREALASAILDARNQIFLSASRAQADTFREYIIAAGQDWFDCKLTGRDKIKIKSNAGTATLYFLSTNSTTAQSYHGNVYIDECFWIPKFDLLNKTASAMAAQKQYTRTYFSTPSAMSHSAYPFWTMSKLNDRLRAEKKPLESLPANKQLHAGVLCPDGHFRKIISIHDAIDGGCNLLDIEQLKQEYSPSEFAQLFECKFIDDSASEFTLAELESCSVDRSEWRDFKPGTARPFGNGPVWIGYDPSRTRDGATIVVVAPPLESGGLFRVLEKITLHNAAWAYQAGLINDLTGRYNVQYIGIDVTGPGTGVFELVKNFFPAVTPIVYSVISKTRLVLKARDVISAGRLQYDASWSDISTGFLSIRRTTTSGGQLTYVADRSDRTGHADAAWALMHALANESLDYKTRRKSTYYIPGDNSGAFSTR